MQVRWTVYIYRWTFPACLTAQHTWTWTWRIDGRGKRSFINAVNHVRLICVLNKAICNVVQHRSIKQSSVSGLSVVAKESGFYLCTATNSMGSASQLIRFVVTGNIVDISARSLYKQSYLQQVDLDVTASITMAVSTMDRYLISCPEELSLTICPLIGAVNTCSEHESRKERVTTR